MRTRMATIVCGLWLAVACTTEDAAKLSDPSGEGGSGGGPPSAATCRDLELPGGAEEGSWDPSFTLAGLTGQDGFGPRVFDFAEGEEGELLATGYFRWAGEESVEPLVRLRDGRWENLREGGEPLPEGGFSALASAPDGRIALATYRAREPFGGTIWADLGEGLQVIGDFEGQIRKLAFHGGELWVAGHFQISEEIVGLARFDGESWLAAPGGSPDGPVYEILQEEGGLLVGGNFTTIGGVDAKNVASWDGETWTAHDLQLDSTVYALIRDAEGTLFAGGTMFVAPEEGRGGIARYDGASWELLDGGVSAGFIPGVVSDLELFDGALYVIGCFDHVGGAFDSEEAILSLGVARWRAEGGWESLDDGALGAGSAWFNPVACGDEGFDAIWNMERQRLHVHDGRLYLGGSLAGAGGVVSQSVVAFDGAQWLAVGEAGAGISGIVDNLVAGGSECSPYAMGIFSHAGGEPAPGLARWEDGWKAFGGERPANHFCGRMAVSDSGEVYVGCIGDDEEGMPLGRIFRVGETEWSAVGEPHELGPVHDVAVAADGTLWVAGGSERGYVARLGEDGFEIVEDGFDAHVFRLSLGDPNDDGTQPLLVAGAFGEIDGKPHRRIAHWDGHAWQALGDGVDGYVSAIEYGRESLWVATGHDGESQGPLLARWEGGKWEDVGTPARGLPAPDGESVHTFTTLLERGGKLIATGYVWPEEGGRNAFLFDGERIESIGGGLAAISVDGIALSRDGLFFGGSIAEAGPAEERIPSVGVARFVWE